MFDHPIGAMSASELGYRCPKMCGDAALLHDAIEDQGIPNQEIATSSGGRLQSSFVMEVTNDKSLRRLNANGWSGNGREKIAKLS